MINTALIVGHLSAAPEVRTLPSGRDLAVLHITTRPNVGAVSVPVVMWDPPAWLVALDCGEPLVALGLVRRRFYRAGSTTASRVEVEATFVARKSEQKRIRRALDQWSDQVTADLNAFVGDGSTVG